MAVYAFGTASDSTTSGTYSTTYKSSGGSVVSSEPDLASRLSRIHLSSWLEDDEEKVKKIEPAKHLVKEFFHGDGDTGAQVERWLSELGVGWVLDLADDDASAGTGLLPRAQRNLTEDWIRALNEIMGCTVRFVLGHEVGMERDMLLGPVQLFKETVLKMLPFVDALLAAGDLDAGTDTADATNGAQASSTEGIQLRTLLDVRDAVFSASEGTQLFFGSLDSSVEMEAQRSRGEVLSLLSAKEQKVDKAVWNTMEVVRTSILNDDEWGIQTPQGSPDICKVTRSLVTYIRYLVGDFFRVGLIVRTAAELGNYVPEQDQTGSLTTLTMEMVSSLEVKLHKRSESFPDQSLRFLFLINNTHFIWQQLIPLIRMQVNMSALTPKIEDYIQKYLQVSWEPVLSCLHNDTPRCYRKNSALPKFD
ncbi:unnamed protein product [Urochloa decumbens]|uniref:Exocyst subunit Exo70 family protein n=1 Tax=Urochloa decumbens TaxID=240449 RepID=A0ABC9B3L6_9POAL